MSLLMGRKRQRKEEDQGNFQKSKKRPRLLGISDLSNSNQTSLHYISYISKLSKLVFLYIDFWSVFNQHIVCPLVIG